MDELWKIIIAVIAGFGGTAGLIILIVKWASGLITEKIQKDYDLKLEKKLASYKAEIDKELEKHRSALGNKNYITQKKFDVEFEMYQVLAEKYYNLVKEASTLIPTGLTHVPADKKVREAVDEQTYKDLCKALSDAQYLIFRYAPFIQKDIYDGYADILRLCNQHRLAFAERWDVSDFRSKEEKESFSLDDYRRTDEINQKFDEVNQTIREYLQSLEILE